MKLRKNKKGFTIVELVIVIAVIGILTAVLVPVFLNLTQKANEASDQSLVKNLNTIIATAEAEPGYKAGETPTKNFAKLDKLGYNVERIIKGQKSGKKVLYSLEKNRFLFEEDKESGVNDDKYWEFVSANNTNEYSKYLYSEFSGTANVKAGVDVGENDDVTEINYTSSTYKNSVIRTNGGTLTINAPEDAVRHFGTAKLVNLTAVGTSSYYENGDSEQVNIKKGRLVLTNKEEASVGTVYLQATGETYDNIILATQEGTKLPELIARDNVSLPEGTDTKKVVTIQSNVNEEGKNPDKTETINLYSTKGTTGNDVYEATNGYNVSNLALLVVEASSTDAKKQASEQITNPEALERVEESKTSVEVKTLSQLQEELDKGTKYIIIGADFTANAIIEVNSNVIIDGANHKITSSASRVLWVDNNNINLTLRNLTLDANKVSERGIQVNSDIVGYTITLDHVDVTNVKKYAINMCGGTSGTLSASNSSFSGWSALNTWGSGHKMTFDRCELVGTNDKKVHSSNSYATICLEADTTYQTADYSSFNTITLNGCTIKAIETNANTQRIVHFNGGVIGATGNKLITNNCTFVSEHKRAYLDRGQGNSWVNDGVELIPVISVDVSGVSFNADGKTATGTIKITVNDKQVSFNLSSVTPQPWSDGTDYVFRHNYNILTYVLDFDVSADSYGTGWALYVNGELA